MPDLLSLLAPGSGSSFDFKGYSVYGMGARWGMASKASVDLNMEGGKRYFDRGVYIGSSWGPLVSALSINSFVPVGGRREQEQAIEALSFGKYVFVTAGEIGRQFAELGWMQVKSARVETDMVRSNCIIDVTFEGGSPDFQTSTAALPLRLALT